MHLELGSVVMSQDDLSLGVLETREMAIRCASVFSSMFRRAALTNGNEVYVPGGMANTDHGRRDMWHNWINGFRNGYLARMQETAPL